MSSADNLVECAVERALLVGDQASIGESAVAPTSETIENGLFPSGLTHGRRRELENCAAARISCSSDILRAATRAITAKISCAVERALLVEDQSSVGESNHRHRQ